MINYCISLTLFKWFCFVYKYIQRDATVYIYICTYCNTMHETMNLKKIFYGLCYFICVCVCVCLLKYKYVVTF
jgi:hypothetical protein